MIFHDNEVALVNNISIVFDIHKYQNTRLCTERAISHGVRNGPGMQVVELQPSHAVVEGSFQGPKVQDSRHDPHVAQ